MQHSFCGRRIREQSANPSATRSAVPLGAVALSDDRCPHRRDRRLQGRRRLSGLWGVVSRLAGDERPSTRLPGEQLKTKGSNRVVPLPQALLDEGFVAYVAELARAAAVPRLDGGRRHAADRRVDTARAGIERPADQPRP